MSKKEEILKRSAKRRVSVNFVSKSNDNSFLRDMSVKELWEITAKISKEGYFLQTGLKAPNRVNKEVVHVSNTRL